MKILRGILFCILLCSPLAYAAQGTPDQNLSKELKGKTVLLRGTEAGNQLAFDAQGAEVGSYKIGPFAYSGVTIKKIHQSKSKLEIQGTRAVWYFDTTSQAPSTADIRFVPVKAKVKITIAIDPNNPDAVKPAILKVLAFTVQDALTGEPTKEVIAKLATVGSLAPPLDSPLLAQNRRTMPPVLMAGAYIGKGMAPPHLTYSVDPTFPDSARQSHTGGLVVLTLIVNAEGQPVHIRIARSAGHDFDVAAITAASQYRFSPAIYQGKPVPVWIDVVVNFRVI